MLLHLELAEVVVCVDYTLFDRCDPLVISDLTTADRIWRCMEVTQAQTITTQDCCGQVSDVKRPHCTPTAHIPKKNAILNTARLTCVSFILITCSPDKKSLCYEKSLLYLVVDLKYAS